MPNGTGAPIISFVQFPGWRTAVNALCRHLDTHLPVDLYHNSGLFFFFFCTAITWTSLS